MKVYSDDGKCFENDVKRCEKYESDLKLQRQLQEEERLKKEQKQKELLDKIQANIKQINELSKEFSSLSNQKIMYFALNGNLDYSIANDYVRVFGCSVR
jgi:fructose-1,6-bisphosphatase